MAKKIFWLSASFVLALASCGGSTPTGPQLKINESRNGLVWEKVEGAVSYEIEVDGVKDLVNRPEYPFSTSVGNHTITVASVDEQGVRGVASSFNYETKESQLSDLKLADNKITWESASTCGLEYKVDNGEYKAVVGDFIEAKEQGLYTVVAPSKIDDNHVFYNKKVEKYVIVTHDAEGEYILEDATAPDDATLSESYTKLKFADNAWVSAGSDVNLDKSSGAYINGNAASFKLWRHSMYYMFQKDIDFRGAYNELSFSMKSVEGVDLYLAFQVAHTMVVGNMDLNGVYITYPIPEAPTKWTHYRVTLDDPNWVVTFNGMKLPFTQIQNIVKGYGFQVNRLADFLPYFDYFQLRIRAQADQIGSTVRAEFDDIKLLNSDLTKTEIEEIIPRLSLAESYAFKSDEITAGGLSIEKDHKGTFSVPGMDLEVPVSWSIENNLATIKSVEEGKDFEVVFSSLDGGGTLRLESASGSLASIFKNIVVEAVNKLDDYESYEETGVGLDKNNNDEELTSGLRKAYYSDFYDQGYNGFPQSAVGDSNWSVMGSSDYLLLNKEDGHTGNQSMSIKAGGNPCRFMNDGLRTGNSTPYKGKYLSLWLKYVLSSDATVVICCYSTNQLNASNHVSDAVRVTTSFTADHTNTEWHEFKLELDPNKTYFGFSILAKDGPYPAGRILVDDVYIYGDLSPWGK